MQRLCAPTREEVDRAHASKQWLDIGILSLRNLTKISRRRLAIWIVIMFSSIPLHLFYNSAVFAELHASSYMIRQVQESFFHGAKLGYSYSYNYEETKWLQNHIGQMNKLENADCIRTYLNPLVYDYSDVLLVIKDSTYTTENKTYGYEPLLGTIPYSFASATNWICNNSEDCTADKSVSNGSWQVMRTEVKYCMALKVPEECALKFSFVILLTVIICNFLKAACMVYTVLRLSEPTLVTIGDAINSFLQNSDKTATGICTASRTSIKKGLWQSAPIRHEWDPSCHLWFRSSSAVRWIITNILCTIGITLPLILLRTGLSNTNDPSVKHLPTFGFGDANGQTLVSLGRELSLIENILLANAPQLILSVLYVMYNSIYTCELAQAEWTSFGKEATKLRVTVPGKGQISSYWLELPYSYSLPLMVTATVLHWLFSRSIFLVNIVFKDYRGKSGKRYQYSGEASGEANNADISQCGYSPLAIVLSASLSTLFIIVGVANGLRRYPAGPPLAATCSAALSAACHPPPEEAPDLAFGPVQWGDVGTVTEDGIRHLSLSGLRVQPPDLHALYS